MEIKMNKILQRIKIAQTIFIENSQSLGCQSISCFISSSLSPSKSVFCFAQDKVKVEWMKSEWNMLVQTTISSATAAAAAAKNIEKLNEWVYTIDVELVAVVVGFFSFGSILCRSCNCLRGRRGRWKAKKRWNYNKIAFRFSKHSIWINISTFNTTD